MSNSILQDIVDNTPDPVVIAAGTQATLRIKKAVFCATKGGKRDDDTEKPIRPQVMLYFGVDEEPKAQLISVSLWFPVEGDTDEVVYNQKVAIKKSLNALGIKPKTDGEVDMSQFKPGMDPIALPKWAGKSGLAILDVEAGQGGLARNVVKSWVEVQAM